MFKLVICLVLALFVFQSSSIRVTCIGDSITEGGGCGAGNYVTRLQEILGSAYQVTNAGRSSMTQLKKGECNGGGDCSYRNTDQWQLAQKSSADIVTIMLGTNDAKAFNWEGVQQSYGDYYALDYVDMINVLRQQVPPPAIFIAVPPPLYEPYPFEMNKTVINDIFPVLIRDIASVTGSNVVDVYSALNKWDVPSANKTCDGCHPSLSAVEIIAQTFADAILKKY